MNKGNFEEAHSVLKEHGLKRIELGAKEGLALINGTQLIAAVGAEAVCRALNVARQADVVAGKSLCAQHATQVTSNFKTQVDSNSNTRIDIRSAEGLGNSVY